VATALAVSSLLPFTGEGGGEADGRGRPNSPAPQNTRNVIPAQAGIQTGPSDVPTLRLDSRLRGNDTESETTSGASGHRLLPSWEKVPNGRMRGSPTPRPPGSTHD